MEALKAEIARKRKLLDDAKLMVRRSVKHMFLKYLKKNLIEILVH